jgi:hypothetical protein
LEQQHKERTEIRIKAENEMEDTKKEIENLKKPLKEKNK